MAKLPAFLSHNNNHAASATTTLAATSADATYPASNLKVLPISKVWRSATAAITNVDVTLDFGSAKSIGLVALINHNLTSTATIAIAAGTTTSYADFSTSMTWREFDAFWYSATAQSYRYWRIRITDSSSTDNYIEVGYVLTGSATVLVSAFAYGWIQADEYENQQVESEFGVPYVSELFYRKRFQFTFRNKSAAEMTAIRNVFTDVKRNVTPLLFIPDTGVNDGYFGRFNRHLERQTEYKFTAQLDFVEDSRGKKIAA